MTRTLDPVNLAVLNGRLVGHAEPRKVLGDSPLLIFRHDESEKPQ